ncbi:MAG TPA: cupin-like domain-containing protein [Planctomycetota bacterium]|nr:cupin-like domain-containing protein [Planctomycetota bacterium]
MKPEESVAPKDRPPLASSRGPLFEFAEETTWDSLRRDPSRSFEKPLLVKGAVRAWPAGEKWTFSRLAELRRADGSDVICRFQDGLVEQGATRPLPVLPVAPYLRELAEASRNSPGLPEGLLPERTRASLRPGEPFPLHWAHLRTLDTRRKYLADWPILHEFPELRRDFAIRSLWPGWRHTWEYVFIGPAHTVTGLHLDIHNNWFCQIQGTKELILFPPDQSPRMFPSRKYNLGSVLSTINIARLEEDPRKAAEFEQARGIYVRAEAGDALYIPKNTWHAVVALTPSISLGIFGLRPWEVLTEGAWAELKNVLHLLRLYRWRNCICHEAVVR